MMNDRTRPQANRTILGILLAMLFVAIVLALWFLLFDRDGSASSAAGDDRAGPTPLTIATSTPDPLGSSAGTAPTAAPLPTSTPAIPPTAVPEGFTACADGDKPLVTSSYIVDTNTTPLNQRSEPAVSADQVGTFDPAQTGLVFTGDCVVNVTDGFTWWEIFNGTTDVWIASDFVTVS